MFDNLTLYGHLIGLGAKGKDNVLKLVRVGVFDDLFDDNLCPAESEIADNL